MILGVNPIRKFPRALGPFIVRQTFYSAEVGEWGILEGHEWSKPLSREGGEFAPEHFPGRRSARAGAAECNWRPIPWATIGSIGRGRSE